MKHTIEKATKELPADVVLADKKVKPMIPPHKRLTVVANYHALSTDFSGHNF